MSHNLAVITTVYQNYTVLKDFLKSLENQTDQNFELFISDLSTEKKKIQTHAPLTVIESDNRGYAYGINLGLHAAQKKNIEKFVIINNDVYFKDDFIKNIAHSLQSHPSSIIGGKIYYADGYEYHKDRYKKADLGKVIWYAGGSIDWDHATTPHRGVDEIDHGQFDQFETTEFITGAMMCYDKSVHEKIGFWDESYFLYYEDSDFCMRAKNKDVKLYYDPDIVLWHKVSQSTEGSGSALHQRYQTKNQLKFGLKYAPLKTRYHLAKNFLFNQINKK